MQRLLQGDVGSGKTVVALYALLRGVERGHRGALMAPTETLAEQHFLTIEPLCGELGVRVALLTGHVKRRRRGEAQVVVGTHALIQAGRRPARALAVAVVDEQHRFGVEQRRALVEGRTPHVLHMTATPIPRTLALTLYGDLVGQRDRQAAREPQAGQDELDHARAVVGGVHPTAPAARRGRQAYVVCPVIEESETRQARAAEAEAERLRRAELRGFRVGCLHGRPRPADRRALMAQFKACELDVLVATTVIEVGVDVPNATVMIVQEADRFGLRSCTSCGGRVGRGGEQSYCLLVSRAKEELTDSARPARGDGRDHGRLRARRARPRDPGRGGASRDAPGGRVRPALRARSRRPRPAEPARREAEEADGLPAAAAGDGLSPGELTPRSLRGPAAAAA